MAASEVRKCVAASFVATNSIQREQSLAQCQGPSQVRFFLSDDFCFIILFFEKFFILAYDEINEPMILRAIILSKN
jgi:hypothetical protein